MLISFSLENWMSFRNPVTFSMVATKERQHGDRVPRIKKYNTKILPIAAVYGGNASGKSNFFKALDFSKTLVVFGTPTDSLIPVKPFQLDAQNDQKPSRFRFELLIDETLYEFSFAVTREAVLEEKLIEINSATEKVLYDRRDGKPNLDKSLAKDQFLNFAFNGTRDNQLFLTNSISQKVDRFRPVHDWFKYSLGLVSPHTSHRFFEPFFDEENPFYITLNEMLSQLDTGISRLGGEDVPLDKLPFSARKKSEILEKISINKTTHIVRMPPADQYVISCKDGDLIAKKLGGVHTRTDGTETLFDIYQESDGTQRLIALLPAFVELSAQASQKVYVIDEIDRSLHALLTRKLLETYLASCSAETRSQLLFTTHDVLLMDQKLLRRDEMWVTERDASGSSSLFSFSDYKDVRYDKDIRKSYLQGRLGGIPRILRGSPLSHSCSADENFRELADAEKA